MNRSRHNHWHWTACAGALTIISFQACTPNFSYKENAVPSIVNLSPRLQKIFTKTKLVCFGRYALEVPFEAQIVFGPQEVEVFGGGSEARERRIAADIASIKTKDKTAEFTYNGAGPVDASWQLRYFEGSIEKKHGLHFFDTYLTFGEFNFIFGGSLEEMSEAVALEKHADRVKSLRPRAVEEVPPEPGLCIEHGFLALDSYDRQEIFHAGIFLPSIPDVSFSVSSNKDAYADYTPADVANARLRLLERIEEAKQEQGDSYPHRKVLREGKRKVQHWNGEESLIKRPDGTHDFEWALVGTPKDVANPSEFNAVMFTKVAHNTVGAAPAASLSDEEAVALFDKLLSGLKFRVKVPNAPPGSYYYPSENATIK